MKSFKSFNLNESRKPVDMTKTTKNYAIKRGFELVFDEDRTDDRDNDGLLWVYENESDGEPMFSYAKDLGQISFSGKSNIWLDKETFNKLPGTLADEKAVRAMLVLLKKEMK